MNYENWISYRYLTASKGRFLSFLNFVSVTGVAIGVAALIVVTGVMTGFGNNLREKIMGTTPHIIIEKESGLSDYQDVLSQLSDMEGIEGATPFIQGNIFLEDQGSSLAVAVRGIDARKEKKVTKVDQYVVEGDLDALDANGVFIGKELARYFGYSVGDVITLIAPGSGLAGKGWRYTLKVAGIFDTGMADFDMHLLVVRLDKAQEIFDLKENTVTAIGVRLKNLNQAPEIKKQIYRLLGYSFVVRTWIDVNRNLFEALFLEKWGLFIVLTLMVIVASFNIVSTLVVTVTSKTHDIGILKSIGVPARAIRNIFTRQGLYIGSIGIFWGLLSGFVVSYVLKTYVKVPAKIYSIDHVPVQLQFFDILMTVSAAILISYAASIYPAIRASKLQPVEALRYE